MGEVVRPPLDPVVSLARRKMIIKDERQRIASICLDPVETQPPRHVRQNRHSRREADRRLDAFPREANPARVWRSSRARPVDLKGNNLSDVAASAGCLFGDRERFILAAKPVKGLNAKNGEATCFGRERHDDIVADLHVDGRPATRFQRGVSRQRSGFPASRACTACIHGLSSARAFGAAVCTGRGWLSDFR